MSSLMKHKLCTFKVEKRMDLFRNSKKLLGTLKNYPGACVPLMGPRASENCM